MAFFSFSSWMNLNTQVASSSSFKHFWSFWAYFEGRLVKILGSKVLPSQTQTCASQVHITQHAVLCSPSPQLFSEERSYKRALLAHLHTFLCKEAWRLAWRRSNLSPAGKAESVLSVFRHHLQYYCANLHSDLTSRLRFGTVLLLCSLPSTPCFPKDHYICVKCHLDVIILLLDSELSCL